MGVWIFTCYSKSNTSPLCKVKFTFFHLRLLPAHKCLYVEIYSWVFSPCFHSYFTESNLINTTLRNSTTNKSNSKCFYPLERSILSTLENPDIVEHNWRKGPALLSSLSWWGRACWTHMPLMHKLNIIKDCGTLAEGDSSRERCVWWVKNAWLFLQYEWWMSLGGKLSEPCFCTNTTY